MSYEVSNKDDSVPGWEVSRLHLRGIHPGRVARVGQRHVPENRKVFTGLAHTLIVG